MESIGITKQIFHIGKKYRAIHNRLQYNIPVCKKIDWLMSERGE